MKRFLPIFVVVCTLLLAVGLFGTSFSPVSEAFASAEEAVEKAEETVGEAVAVVQTWAMSKHIWASMALMFSVLGTSWAQSRIGVAGAGAMAEKPELAGTFIILIAIPETMVILGFVISAMLILMT